MDKHDPLDRRHVTSDEALNLCRDWMHLWQDMTGRAAEISFSAASDAGEALMQGVFGPWAPESCARVIARTYANAGLELLSVPSSSIGVAATAIERRAPALPARLQAALAHTAPPARSAPVRLQPAEARDQIRFLTSRGSTPPKDLDIGSLIGRVAETFLLPARILDASQATASWFISDAMAQGLMTGAVESGHLPPAVLDHFAPLRLKGGDAMVTLLATDYRASDFGTLKEIGLTLTVTPRSARASDIPDPGQLFIRLIVTDPYSIVAATRIWGIRKDLWDSNGYAPFAPIDAVYDATRMRMGIGSVRPAAIRNPDRLELSFPRFGKGRSRAVPGGIYAMRATGAQPGWQTEGGSFEPIRTTLMRSGATEGVQFGGPVTLGLPESQEKGQAHGCLCSSGMTCLCATLRDLGLNKTRPAINSWTESMTGTLEKPVSLA